MKDYIYNEPQRKGPSRSMSDNFLVWGGHAKILDHGSTICTASFGEKKKKNFRWMGLNQIVTQLKVGSLTSRHLITGLLDQHRSDAHSL